MKPAGAAPLIRWLTIAAGAVLLASCRSITAPPAAVSAFMATAIVAEADSIDGPGAAADTSPKTTSATTPVNSQTASAVRDSAVRRAGLEIPSPPLPRFAPSGAVLPVPLGSGPAVVAVGGWSPAGAGPVHAGGASCGPACRGTACHGPACRLPANRLVGRGGGCQEGACQDSACGPVGLPIIPLPVVGPCLVCDGGDHQKPAYPQGQSGIGNITSGDTVARYRAAGGPKPDFDEMAEAQACLVESNCTCVYAPRFSSVRQVTRPFENAVLTAPRGLALDTLAEAEAVGQGVCDKTQQTQLVAARRVQPGLSVEDRIPVLAVDKVVPPRLKEAFDGPAARVLDLLPERVHNVDAPRLKMRIEVPLAWSCVSAAQVTVNGEAADVLAVDHGVATLRLESPGRCELTLSKRAGSDTARPGEELDFTIFMLNSGDRPLTDVVLVDAVPGRLEVIEGSPVSNLPADIATARGEDGSTKLSWKFSGTLKPGQSGFVRFRTIVH
ncbi:MAG: DUF11 domain-containing protein [Planctomycetota bacterium]|nr:MAG: DUF11 domain-containing protein [Planctomycetota bacterium]